jgi:hypothetical protein
MKLTLDDFPIQARCRTAQKEAWPQSMFNALVGSLGFGPRVELRGSFGTTGPRVDWAALPDELTGGLLVHGTKRHKDGSEQILVSYALFAPTGQAIRWSSDLDEDTTTKSPTKLSLRHEDGSAIEVDAKIKAAIKALRAAPAKKPSGAASPKAASSKAASPKAVSPNAAAAASGSPTRGGVVRVGADLPGLLQATAFAPHGRTVFVGGESGLGRIVAFDAATGQRRHELPFKPPVLGLSVAPTGDRLIICASKAILADVDGADRLTRRATLSSGCTSASWAPSGALAFVNGMKPCIVDREGKDVATIKLPKKKLSGEACSGGIVSHAWRDDGALVLLALHRRFAGSNAVENELELHECDGAGSLRATGLRRTVPGSRDFIELAPSPSRERFWLVTSLRVDEGSGPPLVAVTCELFDAKTFTRIGAPVTCPPFSATHAATAVALDNHRVLIATLPEAGETEIRIVDHPSGTTRLLAPFVTHRATKMTAGPNGYVAFTPESTEPGRAVTIAQPG